MSTYRDIGVDVRKTVARFLGEHILDSRLRVPPCPEHGPRTRPHEVKITRLFWSASTVHCHVRMKTCLRIVMSYCVMGALALSTRTAHAQEIVIEEDETDIHSEEHHEAHPTSMVFIEATGAYGLQFGRTDYLPSGGPTNYEHPIAHGFGVGATAGVNLIPGVALMANYEYSNARTRQGWMPGIIDEVQGKLDYHTIVAGIRLSVPAGIGFFQAEFGVGVLLPFETELNIAYGPQLAGLPTPITGTGSMISNYSVGFGGHGMVGYRIPIAGVLYTAINLKLRTFESENSGETTQLRNFVTDFTAQPPTATTADISHGEGAARPTTQSVQDVRLQLAFGAEF